MSMDSDREARRVGLVSDLERYEARGSVLRGQLQRAQAAFAAALSGLATAQRLFDGNEEECTDIRRLISFDPAVLNTFPVELLQTIWGHLSDMTLPRGRRDPMGIVDAEYCAARALLPGRLASVCRRWRHVALNTPELWTYIALPRTGESIAATEGRNARLLYYVDCQLQRSQQLGLELVLGCDSSGPLSTIAASNEFASIMALLHAVLDHAHRWRSVKIQFPFGNAAPFQESMFGTSTPMLEELFIAAFGDLAVPWLKSSPRLRALYATNVRFRLLPGSALSSVTSTSLTVTGEHLPHFWNLLRALPCLTRLSLRRNGSSLIIMGEPLKLHALEALTLRGNFGGLDGLLSRSMIAPRLKRLNLELGMVGQGSNWGGHFFTAFPNIIDLELVGDGSFITPERAVALNNMKRIQRVTLINCHLRREGRFVADAFNVLDTSGDTPSGQGVQIPPDLAADRGGYLEDDRHPPPFRPTGLVWPDLQSLTIHRAREPWDNWVFNDLLVFVRTRATFNATRGKAFELSVLEWPKPFPSWFRHAIGYMLGPGGVHLTTSEGISYDPVGHDGEDTESDATSSGAEDSDASNTESSEDLETEEMDVDV
ncbi:hypothetical protein AURDEDRAFT_182282 [Auricularia subglabra TFB-10046 SS5]|nr:hypothetical protein AURDEDRAFT_182282 [Auricularia subglabra TFB-10046 SS5]